MEALFNMVRDLKERVHLAKEYDWEIPEGCPIEIPSKLKGNLVRNLHLRRNMSEVIQQLDDLSPHYWVIRDWGRIRSFPQNERNDARIRSFIQRLDLEEDTLPREEYEVLPSLSKLATFAYPKRYAIYDARAVFAYNWILAWSHIRDNLSDLSLYPKPIGQNRQIENYRLEMLLELSGIDFQIIPRSRAYHQYCEWLRILSDVVLKQEDPQELEMLLWSIATTLVPKSIQKDVKVKISPRKMESENGFTYMHTLDEGVTFGYHFERVPETIVAEPVDCFILSSHYGYSPLGSFAAELANLTGHQEEEIRLIADWNEYKNDEPACVGFHSKSQNKKLKGFVIGSSPTCHALVPDPTTLGGRPAESTADPGYLYDVAYSAIEYAVLKMKATRIAMTHWIQGATHYGNEIVCTFMALTDFCANHPDSGLELLFYTGCCMEPGHFRGLQYSNIKADFRTLGGGGRKRGGQWVGGARRLGGRLPEPKRPEGFDQFIMQDRDDIDYVPFYRMEAEY